jgi:hypothetical protein
MARRCNQCLAVTAEFVAVRNYPHQPDIDRVIVCEPPYIYCFHCDQAFWYKSTPDTTYWPHFQYAAHPNHLPTVTAD